MKRNSQSSTEIRREVEEEQKEKDEDLDRPGLRDSARTFFHQYSQRHFNKSANEGFEGKAVQAVLLTGNETGEAVQPVLTDIPIWEESAAEEIQMHESSQDYVIQIPEKERMYKAEDVETGAAENRREDGRGSTGKRKQENEWEARMTGVSGEDGGGLLEDKGKGNSSGDSESKFLDRNR